MENVDLTEEPSEIKKAKSKFNVKFTFSPKDEDVIKSEDLENEIAKKIFDVYLDETYKNKN